MGVSFGAAPQPAVTRPGQPEGRGGGPGRDDLGARHLRGILWLGVGLPGALLVAFELLRALYLDSMASATAHLIAAGITIGGALAFGGAMFILIDRAHREIVHRNRELAVINAVSVAVQDGEAVREVIDGALRELIAASGALEGAITILPHHRDPGPDDIVSRRAGTSQGRVTDPTRSSVGRHLEIPLLAGQDVVGRLRLTLHDADPAGSGLTPHALLTVGQQLAGTIHARQLLDDLHRRKREGHAFYDVLVQISSQNPLPDILGAIVRYARDLLGADEAAMGMAGHVSDALLAAAAQRPHGQEANSGLTALGDGTYCVTPTPAHFHGVHAGESICPVRASAEFSSILQVELPGASAALGDIWIGRRSGGAYTERDRQSLATLARLAAIAINSARAREGERAEATLAERDRIAREMHDSLAQVLGATHLRLRALSARGDLADAPYARAEVAELADITQEAYRDVREAILGLRQASRIRGLAESLRAYLAKYSQQAGVRAHLEMDGDETHFSAGEEIQLIRVIQEALTNVRKHARATDVAVSIAADRARAGMRIVITDNGRGFDLGAALLDREGGFGLHTMRERMELVGGDLRVESAAAKGTRVIAWIPGRTRQGQATDVPIVDGGERADPNPAR